MRCGRIKGSGIVIDGSIRLGCLLLPPLLALAIVDAPVALVVRLVRVISADDYSVGDFGGLWVGAHGVWVVGLRGDGGLAVEIWDYRVLDGGLDGNGSRRGGIEVGSSHNRIGRWLAHQAREMVASRELPVGFGWAMFLAAWNQEIARHFTGNEE